MKGFKVVQCIKIDSFYICFVYGCCLPLGEGWLLVNCVPMREQRTVKLTLNSVFDILKLIPFFTVSSQKATLSNVVIKRHTHLLLQPFPKFVKKHTLFLQNSIFPTLNDDIAAHCPARKKSTLSHRFFFHASVHN